MALPKLNYDPEWYYNYNETFPLEVLSSKSTECTTSVIELSESSIQPVCLETESCSSRQVMDHSMDTFTSNATKDCLADSSLCNIVAPDHLFNKSSEPSPLSEERDAATELSTNSPTSISDGVTTQISSIRPVNLAAESDIELQSNLSIISSVVSSN